MYTKPMSRLIASSRELSDLVRSKPKVMVLFYADWCAFSRAFLPCFEAAAADRDPDMVRVLVDDAREAAEAFGVEVYPTVLFFEGGRLVKRLDGRSGLGLDERQLRDFVAACGI